MITFVVDSIYKLAILSLYSSLTTFNRNCFAGTGLVADVIGLALCCLVLCFVWQHNNAVKFSQVVAVYLGRHVPRKSSMIHGEIRQMQF
jgi:hypothetical protein